MKKYIVTIAIFAVVAACNSNTSSSNSSDSSANTSSASPKEDDVSANPDYQKGLALVAANDCLTCHKVDEKVTGPAYRDVANKYENTDPNVKMLADKIIKGGSGNWGTIPMTPHAALSQADAEQMVKYILLLRNK